MAVRAEMFQLAAGLDLFLPIFSLYVMFPLTSSCSPASHTFYIAVWASRIQVMTPMPLGLPWSTTQMWRYPPGCRGKRCEWTWRTLECIEWRSAGEIITISFNTSFLANEFSYWHWLPSITSLKWVFSYSCIQKKCERQELNITYNPLFDYCLAGPCLSCPRPLWTSRHPADQYESASKALYYDQMKPFRWGYWGSIMRYFLDSIMHCFSKVNAHWFIKNIILSLLMSFCVLRVSRLTKYDLYIAEP